MITRNPGQILAKLHGCDVDAVATILAAEQQPAIAAKMYELVEKVASESVDATYLPDWLAIYQFLQKPEQVEVYIEQFEAELQEFAAHSQKKSQLKVLVTGSYALPRDKVNPYQTHKILSGCLYQWAAQNGFAQPVKIVTALDKEVFFNLLTSKSLMKDAAADVGYEHGTWSHALQWYVIFEHHKRSNFLKHSPMEVYANFGALPPKEFATNEMSIWMVVLDQLNINNFTSPEFMMQTIKHVMKRDKWPLLYDCVHRNWEKMNWKYGSIAQYAEHEERKHDGEHVAGVVFRKF